MPRRLCPLSGAEIVVPVEVGLRGRPGGLQDEWLAGEADAFQVGLDGGGIGDRGNDAHT